MNKYIEWKEEYQKRINEFPMKFAFSQEALERGMKELGLNPHETGKIVAIGGGGFIRATDVDAFNQLFDGRANELRKMLTDDSFLYDALVYELFNHEYGYTGDPDDAIYAIGLTPSEIVSDPRMRQVYNKASEYVMQHSEC